MEKDEKPKSRAIALAKLARKNSSDNLYPSKKKTRKFCYSTQKYIFALGLQVRTLKTINLVSTNIISGIIDHRGPCDMGGKYGGTGNLMVGDMPP